MNIALLSPTPLRYDQEATTITLLGLAQTYIQKGHQVAIFAKKVKGLPGFEKKEEVPIYRGFQPVELQKYQHRRRIKFDIIHGFSSNPLFFLYGLWASYYSTRARLIHSLKSYPQNSKSRYFHFLLNLADRMTVPTKVFARRLTSVSWKKKKVVYSSVRDNFFQEDDGLLPDKDSLKIKHGYKGQKIVFYYGSLHRYKGVPVLISTIPKFVEKVKFVFAPRYQPTKELQMIRRLGVQEQVDFVEDVPITEYVAMADAVVLPYLSLVATEGNPSCLLEAMASKTAVVTTDLPELREIAEGCVVFALPGDVNSLAEAINQVLDQPDEEKVLRAFEKAKEFKLEKISEEFLELYKKARKG